MRSRLSSHLLSGQTRQGRIGIGYAALRGARNSPAASATLEILDVDRILQSITETSGSGSQRQRLELLQSMFSRATEPEQQFLTGLLMGELRQGALEGIMLEGVAKAAGLPPDRVRRAAMMAGDIARVARAALDQGVAGLAQYDVQLFRPIQPMLAQSADDVPEGAGLHWRSRAREYKMDGARVQVHKSGDDVVVYSRSLKDVTPAVPEVVELTRALPAKDPHPGRRSHQPAARRPAAAIPNHHAALRTQAGCPSYAAKSCHMTPFWFDLLYLNGGPLLDEPQARRFAALSELSREHLIPNLVTNDARAADEFLEQALARGHEGNHGQGNRREIRRRSARPKLD